MKKTELDLTRFKEILKYTDKLVVEQDMPGAPMPPMGAGTPPPPLEGTTGPAGAPPPDPALDPSMSGQTPTNSETGETPPEEAPQDDSTEELDITDLVNMTKSIKKQLDDTQGKGSGESQKIDGIFTKLNDLEKRLGEMDQVMSKIDELGAKLDQVKPKTPMEKLEMRSLDSYPFNKKPDEFFNEKQEEMKTTGKNEYVLTKGDVENYGKNEIMKSFNPKASQNDFNF